jgi:hypothetical protein
MEINAGSVTIGDASEIGTSLTVDGGWLQAIPAIEVEVVLIDGRGFIRRVRLLNRELATGASR